MPITDAELRHPHFLIGVIAAVLESVDTGQRTPAEAIHRLRDVLTRSGHYHPDTVRSIEPPSEETGEGAVAPDGGQRGPL